MSDMDTRWCPICRAQCVGWRDGWIVVVFATTIALAVTALSIWRLTRG